MVTKAAPKKSNAAPAAKKPTGQMNTYKEELAALARAKSKEEAKTGGGAQFISFKGGDMTIDGVDVEGNALRCVILETVQENHFYDTEYDPDQPASPICYAFGSDPDEMKPHEASPQPQCDSCAECPHNEWGSADKGKGKACSNVRRIAVMAEDGLDDPDNAEVRFAKIPVMSVKNLAKYVKDLDRLYELPPLGVVTEMSLKKDIKSLFRVNFKMCETIEDGATIKALIRRAKAVYDDMSQAYPETTVEEKPKKSARKNNIAGKNAAGKKGSTKPAPRR